MVVRVVVVVELTLVVVVVVLMVTINGGNVSDSCGGDNICDISDDGDYVVGDGCSNVGGDNDDGGMVVV